MVSKSERYFGIYEISARPFKYPDAPGQISIQALKRVQASVKKAKEDKRPLSKEIIPDVIDGMIDDFEVKEDKGVVVILFTVADTDAADAVYRRRATTEFRSFEKGPDEGGAVSAHLIMKLTPQPNSFRYLAALEDIEGAARSRLLPIIEHVFHNVCGSFVGTNSEGTVTGKVKFEMDTLLESKVEGYNGRPLSAEIVQLTPNNRLDAGGEGFKERRRSIFYRIEGRQTPAKAVAAMLSIRNIQKESHALYPIMRVRWKRPDGKQQTLSVGELEDDLMQRALATMELISGINPPLNTSVMDIRWDVVDSVLSILNRYIGNRPADAP